MTRINVLLPEILTDAWLIAEYREMPRISALAKYTKAPTSYTMGTGHVKYFYSKGLFLQKRFEALVYEMKRRGFKPQFDTYRAHPEGLNSDWKPDQDATNTNLVRLLEKFDAGQKHKYWGKDISKDEFLKLVAGPPKSQQLA